MVAVVAVGEEGTTLGYSSNNKNDDDEHNRKTLVYFLQENVRWSPPYTEKLIHFTNKFNQEEDSTHTLCGTRQPISRNTWFEKVTLDKIGDKIKELGGFQHAPPFDIVQLCEHCAEKALKMKKEEE